MPEIIGSGFLTRNIIEHLRSDGSRQFICRTLQNPIAYHDGRQLRPVDIADVADTVTDKAGGIYLRSKNIVSCGIKKADDAYKTIGFRPDECQDGSEQFEISIDTIEVNGKIRPIDLSAKKTLSPLTTDLGPALILSRRQGTRIGVPLTHADGGFKIAFRLHLAGLTISYVKALDEYWLFNHAGQFRFRIRKPLLLDFSTGEPLSYEDGPGHSAGLVQHSLTALGGGEYLYVKEPTESFGENELPEKFLVDANIVYSATADGAVLRDFGTPWSAVHDDTTGTTSYATGNTAMFAAAYSNSYPSFAISRGFFYFSTTGLTGTVTACSGFFYVSSAESNACVQKGTQDATLTVNDYASFSGASYSSATCVASQYNEFIFNSTGIDDVGADLGNTIKLCTRQYSNDYNNITLGASTYRRNSCYMADNTGTSKDPYLSIEVTTGKTGSDTGAGNESITVTAAVSNIDSAVGDDFSQLAIGCVDAGTSSETSELSVLYAANLDSGEGTENSAIFFDDFHADSGSATDSSEVSFDSYLAYDSGEAGETTTLETAADISSDAGGLVASAEMAAEADISTDSGAGLDTAEITYGYYSDDFGTGGDASIIIALSTSDTATATESVTAALRFTRDSGSGTETKTLVMTGSTTDAGTGAEASALALSLSTADSAAGTDATSTLAASWSISDSGAGTEAVSALSKLTIDSASVSDASALAVAGSAGDAGAGSETAGLVFTTASTDSGIGPESSILSASRSITDWGTGADIAYFRFDVSDSGTGDESSIIDNINYTVTDTGTGLDARTTMSGSIVYVPRR